MATSLSDILQDPNYVNANAATKKAIFDKFSAQDTNYTGANEATQKAIRVKFGVDQEAAPTPTATSGEGMPSARVPAWSREYPGLYRAAVTARGTVGPALEAGGAALGGILGTGAGPVGTVAGAGLGYGIARQGLRAADIALGLDQEAPTLGQQAQQAIGDVATGAAYELGGAALTKGAGAALDIGKRAFGGSAAKTIEQLKTESNALRAKMYKTGQQFDPNQLRASVEQGISGVSPEYPTGTAATSIAPNTRKVLDYIDDLVKDQAAGKAIKIDQLEHVNTLLNDAIKAGGRDSVYATAAKNKLNDFADSVGGEAGQLWRQARELEVRQFRSQEIKDMADAASSKDIRKQFQDLLDSNKIRTYTPEQQQLIQQIANGSVTEKALELASNLAPKNLGWANILSVLGGQYYGGTKGAAAALATYGLGAGARGAANVLARSRVNALDELIRGGQLAPPVDLNFLRPAATAGTIFATQPRQNALAQ